jgi:hypothetical protein
MDEEMRLFWEHCAAFEFVGPCLFSVSSLSVNACFDRRNKIATSSITLLETVASAFQQHFSGFSRALEGIGTGSLVILVTAEFHNIIM